MSNKVPVLTLNSIQERSKFSEVENYYRSHFNSSPEFYVRCPGRVNVIGEHIDYSGFNVLPMAIEKDIIMAVGVNKENKFNILNLECLKYKPFHLIDGNVDVSKEGCRWYDYVICGYKGISENFDLKNKHLNIVVKGYIPPSSGLSSSSALVCAGALATTFSNQILLEKTEIADICANAERYIGTQGGGMDQAIIFLGEEGYAKEIEFHPLRTLNVQLPSDIHFIVAHSGVYANKAETSCYNKRVAECHLAAKILAKLNGIDWRHIQKLSDIPSLLSKTVNEMVDCAKQLLLDKEYTRNEICNTLEINESELNDILCKYEASSRSSFETFLIAKRAIHVYTEACNVKDFIISCEHADFEKMGRLLNNSHESLAKNYNCSHEKLDDLVQEALANGAIGARLTGAGWGGCVIAAVKTENKNSLLGAIKAYAIKQGLPEDSTFLTKPSSGAAIYK